MHKMLSFLIVILGLVFWFAIIFLRLDYFGESQTENFDFGQSMAASWDSMIGENEYEYETTQGAGIRILC